jgi:putative transposase
MALHRAGQPVQNAFVESLNGRFRNECLNEHVFGGLQWHGGSLKPGGSTIIPAGRTPALAVWPQTSLPLGPQQDRNRNGLWL